MSGPCSFTAEPDGSFSLAHAGGDQPLFGKILSVSVSLVAPGRAEVRGLTQDGINSRWGAARRSKSDRACWDGDDFRVCAY